MPVEFYPFEEAKSIFDINFFGVLDITQLTLPLLRESHGRIIMISSVAGIFGRAYSSMYTASKFAIEGFSDSLRREVAHFETRKQFISLKSEEQKAIYPGFFSPEYDRKYGEIFAKADTADVTTEVITDAIVSRTPKTRYTVANANGIPAKVVAWLNWLCSDRIMDRVIGGMV
eukprot:gene22576-28709_t